MKNKFLRTYVLLIALCMFITTGKTFAADITPTMPSNVGNFDSGVIDQANIRQFKEYEMKAREERSKEHRGNEQIEMKKEMQQEVDKLPNKEVTFKLNSIKFEGYTAFTEEELMTIRERDEKRLQTMNFYCNTKECLRTYILRYFGEGNQGACGKCGNCRKHYVEKDMTKEAKQVIVCLEELGERYGINVVVGTLLGGKSAKLREYRVDRYSSYASFSKLREQEIKDLIGQMIQDGYLRQTQDKYALLQTTGKAQDLMDDVCTVTVKMEPKSSRAVEEDDRIKGTGKRRSDILNTRGLEFFDVLRGLRTSIAREESLPPYLVFSDKTLVDMCVRLPMNREEMMEVNGMGAYKFEKYGERFLACILENTGGIREKFYFGEIGEVLGKK